MPLVYLWLAAAAAAGTGASASETEVRTVQVELTAPEGCAGADTFFAGLRSRTNRVRRASGNEPHTTLQVRLIRSRGQVTGELRIVDDRGGTDSRRVQGASCEEVVQALSLTAALALDPGALLSAPALASAPGSAASANVAGEAAAAAASSGASAGSTGASSSPTGASAASRTSAASAASPPDAATAKSQERASQVVAAPSAPTSVPAPSVELAVGPVGLTVLSGDWSGGAALGARKSLGGEGVFRPSVGLAVTYVRNDVLQSPGAAQSSLAALAATACPVRFTAGILTFQPCALVLGGWLAATGRGATHTNTVNRLWLSGGGTLRIGAFLGGAISFELEGGVSAPLLKRRFFLTQPTNVVAETPTISPIVGIGLTYGL